MNKIEDEIIDKVAHEIQKEIDEGVMLSLLVEGGWFKVPFNYYEMDKALDMARYCEKTFKKKQWTTLNGHFVFRKKKDAAWFMLRWS